MVCKSLGLSTAIATKWKNGSIPRDSALLKIANYFGVTVEYLKGEEELVVSEDSEIEVIDKSKFYMIPLYESVSAGFGAYASDFVEDYRPLCFESRAEAENTLCIKVRGDSMFPEIKDGDIVQVHKQDSVDNGAIAVVIVDGDEGFVKKVLYDAESITLESINPMYPPKVFSGRDVLRVRVVGLVTNITRGVNGMKVYKMNVAGDRKAIHERIDKLNGADIKAFNKLLNDFIRSKEKK